MDLGPAHAISVRMGCIRPMPPVRPDRPVDVFSHPMRLVSLNTLISPPMHPARLVQTPSVPTRPSSFPLLRLSSDGIWRTHAQFLAPGPPAPYLLPPPTKSAPWHLILSGSFRHGCPRATFLFFPTGAPLIEV